MRLRMPAACATSLGSQSYSGSLIFPAMIDVITHGTINDLSHQNRGFGHMCEECVPPHRDMMISLARDMHV